MLRALFLAFTIAAFTSKFRFPRSSQCQAHRFSLTLKVDLQDRWMVFGEIP
jgi:hypothetical protein